MRGNGIAAQTRFVHFKIRARTQTSNYLNNSITETLTQMSNCIQLEVYKQSVNLALYSFSWKIYLKEAKCAKRFQKIAKAVNANLALLLAHLWISSHAWFKTRQCGWTKNIQWRQNCSTTETEKSPCDSTVSGVCWFLGWKKHFWSFGGSYLFPHMSRKVW